MRPANAIKTKVAQAEKEIAEILRVLRIETGIQIEHVDYLIPSHWDDYLRQCQVQLEIKTRIVFQIPTMSEENEEIEWKK